MSTSIIFHDHFQCKNFHDSVDGELQALKNQLNFRGAHKRKIVPPDIFVSYVPLENSFFVLHNGAEIGVAEGASVPVATPVIIGASKQTVRTFPEILHEYEPNALLRVVDTMYGVELLTSIKNGVD